MLLGRKVETGGEEDEGGDPGECDGGGWVEEAVVADFHEAFRQDVLEESADGRRLPAAAPAHGSTPL